MSEKQSGGEPVAAFFRAMVRNDGKMVAGLASVPGGPARFFILERRETDDAFVGRVSAWIKDQGASGLRMERPDVIPDGTGVAEFLLRLRNALAVDGADPDASEFDVKEVKRTMPDPS
jgi:hypothetical protein